MDQGTGFTRLPPGARQKERSEQASVDEARATAALALKSSMGNRRSGPRFVGKPGAGEILAAARSIGSTDLG